MPGTNYLHVERVITRRLVEADLTQPAADLGFAERALADYLAALGLPARPVRWAAGPCAGRDAARHADLQAELDALDAALDRARRAMSEALGGKGSVAPWERDCEELKEARAWRLLESVRRIAARRGPVRHVAWLAYTGRDDASRPDSYLRAGVRDDFVWGAARDATYSVARDASRASASPPAASFKERRLVVADRLAEIFLRLVEAFGAGLWLYWLTPAEVIAVPRPTLRFEGRVLHSADGPAVSWPGGEGYYFLHGVEVVRQVVETPAPQLDPRLVLFERNAQVRAEIVRKVGVERVCAALGARCVDRSGDYELLMLDLRDGRERPFLKMRNPSVPGVYHIEGVAPGCKTVAEALAWRNQTDEPPSVLT